MARRPKPWWNEARGEYNVNIRGERHRLGPDKDEAERKFHELMAKPVEAPMKPDAVVAVIDEFLDYLERKAERTKEWYQRHCQSFVDWLKGQGLTRMLVAQLKPLHVRKWLDSHDWADATKNGAARAVQSAFRWAMKEGAIPANPISYVDKPAPGRRENVISKDQYALMRKKDKAFKDLITVAWESGARPQELIRMSARHLDRDRVIFHIKEAKGKKRVRVIYLNEAALKICKALAKKYPDGPIFRNRNGRPWTSFSLGCRFERLTEKLGKRFALVDFRHTFCDRLIKSGVDPITVATLLGHVDATMVAKQYQHVSQDSEHLFKALRKAKS